MARPALFRLHGELDVGGLVAVTRGLQFRFDGRDVRAEFLEPQAVEPDVFSYNFV